eukprot:2043369-Amphidinium_carterae.2
MFSEVKVGIPLASGAPHFLPRCRLMLSSKKKILGLAVLTGGAGITFNAIGNCVMSELMARLVAMIASMTHARTTVASTSKIFDGDD